MGPTAEVVCGGLEVHMAFPYFFGGYGEEPPFVGGSARSWWCQVVGTSLINCIAPWCVMVSMVSITAWRH